MREKPMCLLRCLIPTTFFMKDYWWLKQLMILEVGWQDCQSSSTRTLYPRFGCSSPHADIHLPLHELLSTHRLQIHLLLVAIYLHALIIWLLIAFTHRKFSWVLPTRFSPAISVLSIAVHFRAEGILPVFVFTHWFLAGFTHAVFPWADLWIEWSYPLLTGKFVGSVHTSVGKL